MEPAEETALTKPKRIRLANTRAVGTAFKWDYAVERRCPAPADVYQPHLSIDDNVRHNLDLYGEYYVRPHYLRYGREIDSREQQQRMVMGEVFTQRMRLLQTRIRNRASGKRMRKRDGCY
jgi:hypothetical protein